MNIKSESGITLMTCVITVIIMFLIVGMIVYSSSNSMKIRDINNLNNDIETVQEKVDIHYLQYGALPFKLDFDGNPIRYEYKELAPGEEGTDSYRSQEGINGYIGVIVKNYPYRNPNDNNVYYEINLGNFENLTLTNYSRTSDDKYVYVVNEASHSVYLISGIRIEKQYYYSPDYSDIPKIEIDV